MSRKGNLRLIFVVAVIIILSIVCIFKPQNLTGMRVLVYPVSEISNEIHLPENRNELDYLVNSPVCKIPDKDPWDKSVKHYFKSSSLVRCSKRPLLTSIVNMKNGSYVLRIEKNKIKSYGVTKSEDLKCCYSEIIRISQTLDKYDGEADNKIRWDLRKQVLQRYTECKNFDGEELLPNATEFIKVTCKRKKRNKWVDVYKDGHPVVPILESALKKMKEPEVARRTLPLNNSQEDAVKVNSPKRLNILIIGIDSVSRLNLRRMMPKTFKYLQKNEWIEMNGYTKIDDNTFPNLMAILCGHFASTIYKTCFRSRSKSLDDCPYIWKNFSDAGYVTAYAEDTPNISTFNYLKTGFVEKPTDYYLRPFMLAVHTLGITKLFGLPVCAGPVAPIDHMFNYARHFLRTFNDFNHFSLFWMNSLSHNNPSAAKNMDQRTVGFLKDLPEIGTYNNTVIFLLSDHGTRFGDFRHSFMGYYEERLPFFFMWIPERFRKQYPKLYDNIVTNQNRLTCPFDVHLTLAKILDNDFTESEGRKLSACPKCKSLFNSIPLDRRCEDAAIEKTWCMCDNFREVPASDSLITRLGEFVAENVFNKTRQLEEEESLNKSVCARWKYLRVVRAHQAFSQEPSETGDGNAINKKLIKITQYIILVEMNPGKTRFEAMVETIKTKSDRETEKFEMISSASRLDGYSKHSQCVHSSHLKYYCYCTNS